MNPNTGPSSHYAVLGERRKDAPMILPPEQAVVYTSLRSNVGGRANMSDGLQVQFPNKIIILEKAVF